MHTKTKQRWIDRDDNGLHLMAGIYGTAFVLLIAFTFPPIGVVGAIFFGFMCIARPFCVDWEEAAYSAWALIILTMLVLGVVDAAR